MEIREIIDTISGIISVSPDEDKALQRAVKILEELEDFEVLEKRIEAADSIWQYYVTANTSEHYNLLKEGIDNYDKPFLVVIGGDNQKEKFEGYKCIKYADLHEQAGTGFPLAWDNAAIIRFISSLSIVQSAFRRMRNILDGSN